MNLLRDKILILLFIFFGLLGLFTNVCADTLKYIDSSRQGTLTIEDVLDKEIPLFLKRYNIPGAAVTIVEDGDIQWFRGYGLADKARGRPIDSNTIFQVASCSKSVTAWGVMKLVEEGKLELDSPVEEYLKSWSLPHSQYNSSKITIRHLLNHAAGIAKVNYPGTHPSEKLLSLEESLTGKFGFKVIGEPEKKFLYSGGGYTLLQLVIEDVTGMAFSEYMQKEILKPLGMDNSSFDFNSEVHEKTAVAYGVMGQQLPNYLFTEKAAAGLYSTSKDIAKFMAAYTGETSFGKNILSKENLSLMYTSQRENYALGCILGTLPNETKVVWHGGANRGWRSRFMICPEEGDGIVILTNSDNGEKLITEIASLWIEWKDGSKPQFYHESKKEALITRIIALLLAVGAVIYSIITSLNIHSGRTRVNIKKPILHVVIHVLMPMTIMILWYMFFYLGSFTQGWAVAAFMPQGFGWLTLAVFLWGVVFGIRGLFLKKKSIHNVEGRN